MLQQLRTFISFKTLCSGCERYYEMLVAMGLALQTPVEDVMLPTDPAQPSPALIDPTTLSIVKAMRGLPHVTVATPSSYDIYRGNL